MFLRSYLHCTLMLIFVLAGPSVLKGEVGGLVYFLFLNFNVLGGLQNLVIIKHFTTRPICLEGSVVVLFRDLLLENDNEFGSSRFQKVCFSLSSNIYLRVWCKQQFRLEIIELVTLVLSLTLRCNCLDIFIITLF